MKTGIATVLLLALLSAPILAGNPAEAYRRLYGDREKTVTASASKEDDAQLAADLLAGAAEVTAERELVELLYEKAYEIGRRNILGYRTALEALTLLGELVPERKAGCEILRLDVLEDLYRHSVGEAKVSAGEELVHEGILAACRRMRMRQWQDAKKLLWDAQVAASRVDSARGEEAENRGRVVEEMLRRGRKAREMEERLAASPGDSALRLELVRFRLIDLDDPSGAVESVGPGVPKAFARNLFLAAREPSTLDEASLLGLGTWYLDLAAETGGRSRRRMLVRSRGFFTDFLARHSTEDESRLKALLALKEVEAAIWRLDRESVLRAGNGHWVDLLAVTDLARDVTAGRWSADESGLEAGGSRSSHLYFPVRVSGGYELEVFFRRLTGDAYPGFVLPCGEFGGLLIVGGWGGDRTGLHEIRGRSGERNETTFVRPIENGRRYRIRVRVEPDGPNVTVKVRLDGKEIISWRGRQEWFRHGDRKPDRGIGLRTNGARIRLYSVKLRMIRGKADLRTLE